MNITDTSEGHEYVEFSQERDTETRSGEAHQHSNQRCLHLQLVQIGGYSKHSSHKHRPEGMNLPELPFYLVMNQKLNEHLKWYENQPLGIHQVLWKL